MYGQCIFRITGKVGGKDIPFLLDSGADVSFISKRLLGKISPILAGCCKLRSVTGQIIGIAGNTRLSVEIKRNYG